jgi:hypothetical protein
MFVYLSRDPAAASCLRIANLQTELTEMKRESYASPATMEATSEKANPSKGGDAKPWIYRHLQRDYDRQAAEEP